MPAHLDDIAWWPAAVVYQIYPRSFADANGDGVGDLDGIIEHLDYLTELGVDALWISPFFRSPMADNGYDINDHRRVDPVFGNDGDADRLIEAAHDRGLKIVLDIVLGHTSDQHAWFIDSSSSRESARRGWYVWHDGPSPGSAGGGPPNDWEAGFPPGASTWTWHPATRQWYLHSYLRQVRRLLDEYPDVMAVAEDHVWPAWFLNNHDEPPVASRSAPADEDPAYGQERAGVAATLLPTLRGTPFLYQGEELGLPDTDLPAGVGRDLNGRDPQRTPMPWAAPSRVGPGAGFTTGTPWLPVGHTAETLNLDSQRCEPTSMFHLYRQLLRLRRARSSLRTGSQTILAANDGLFAYLRSDGHEHTLVALNYGSAERRLDILTDLRTDNSVLLIKTSTDVEAGHAHDREPLPTRSGAVWHLHRVST